MLKSGDWITIKYGEYEGRYAKVMSRKKNGDYGVVLYSDTGEGLFHVKEPLAIVELQEEALELIEPWILGRKELRKLARAELSYSDLAEKVFPPFNVRAERRYTLKIEDIKAALENINQNRPPLPAFKQWFWMILNVFYDSLNIKKRYDENIFSDFPKDEKEIFSTVFGMTEKLYWRLEERLGNKEDNEQYMIRFQDEPDWDIERKEADELEITAYYAVCSDITGRIDSYLMNLDKPQGAWTYSLSQMKHVIDAYETDKDLEGATPEALALYREFVRRLYRVGDLQAIRILAWGYMEGGIAYRQNYVLARNYLQELYDKAADPYAASALGYIYYYGLTNNGIPQYDKAFPYFSYGAMDGIEESIYMAGDMLLHGQGTVRNVDMGLNLLVDGYRNTLNELCHGDFECRFAEYAMFMGNCCMEGLVYGMGTKDAYRFYLEADYAAEKRKEAGHPVEDRYLEKIRKALSYIAEKVGLDRSKTELKADFPIFISQIYEDHYPVKVTITKNKNSEDYTLKVRKFDFRDLLSGLHLPLEEMEKNHQEIKTDMAGRILVTYPELSWSGLVSEMEYRLENGTILKKPEKNTPFLSDGFRRDDNTNVLEFYAHGEVIAALEADWYIVSVNSQRNQ